MSAASTPTFLSASSPSPSALSALNPRPIPLREQAFALHCQGLRSPAISEQLGIPQRTIRAWVAADLKILAEEQRATRREQLALAVERQHALTAAAWSEFEAETAGRHALLDALLHALINSDASPEPTNVANATTAIPRLPHLPASTPAPRYLTLILQADKEIARLLGLYTLAKLDLLTPKPKLDTSATPAMPALSESPAKTATESPLSARGEGPGARVPFPAESATDSQSAQADFVAAGPPGAVLTAGSPLAESAAVPTGDSDIPAESATTPSVAAAVHATPLSAHGEGPGVRFHFPAESATLHVVPLASRRPVARIQFAAKSATVTARRTTNRPSRRVRRRGVQ